NNICSAGFDEPYGNEQHAARDRCRIPRSGVSREAAVGVQIPEPVRSAEWKWKREREQPAGARRSARQFEDLPGLREGFQRGDRSPGGAAPGGNVATAASRQTE